jgi:hypothetical protein
VSEIEPATRAATGLFNPLNESVKSYTIFPGWENTIEKRDSDYQFNPALLSRGNAILIVGGENRKNVTGGVRREPSLPKDGTPDSECKKKKCR